MTLPLQQFSLIWLVKNLSGVALLFKILENFLASKPQLAFQFSQE